MSVLRRFFFDLGWTDWWNRDQIGAQRLDPGMDERLNCADKFHSFIA